MRAAYIEKVAQFGPHRTLTGVLTVPAQPVSGAPGIVLLNSGIIHHVGTNRIAVKMARAFAGLGFASLRFDYSGIGDSERRTDVASLQESVERDIADALTFCGSSTGIDAFVVAGLCSGAYDAMRAAAIDARIVGAVLVDLPGPFRNRRHTLHHLKARLLRPASWSNPFLKLAHYSGELAAPPVPTDKKEKYVAGARAFATREWMEEHVGAALTRNVRLYFIFTTGFEFNYNHESQFRDVFPEIARHPSVSHAFIPNADHAFSRAADRDQLLDQTAAWLKAGWAAQPGDRGEPRVSVQNR